LGAIDASLADSQLTERQLRAVGVIRRFVDALVLERDRVHLVEGKILNRPGALEQLDLYAKLFPLTPEYERYRTFPLVRHLLWAVRDPLVEAIAREHGILVHEYHPAWVDDYLKGLTPRARSPMNDGGLLELMPPSSRGSREGGP